MKQYDQFKDLFLCFYFVCMVERLEAVWIVALCSSAFAEFLTTQKTMDKSF